jgi:hypothetical protein
VAVAEGPPVAKRAVVPISQPAGVSAPLVMMMGNGEKSRQDEWSKSIAVGGRSFIQTVKEFLGIRAKGRDVVEGGQGYQLREAAADYKRLFENENEDIGVENAYFWDLNAE